MCWQLCWRDSEAGSGQELNDGCSSDRFGSDLSAAARTVMTLSHFFTVNSRCRRPVHCCHNMCEVTGGESTSCFPYFGYFAPLNSVQSCVWNVSWDLWYTLMVNFWWCHLLSIICNDVSFLGWGADIVMREGHIIGLQGKHAVHCWCHILGRVLRNGEGLLTSGIHAGRWFARWMALKQVTLSHCFYINYVRVCWILST